MPAEQFFYHLLPSKMVGKELLPLSNLSVAYPKLAKNYRENYKGRDELLTKRIPLLDCTWQDVLFCSCLNPTLIFAALEMLGLLDDEPPTILRFPIQSLKEQKICLYVETNDKERFEKSSKKSYREQLTIPTSTLEYFVQCVKTKEDPLIFFGIDHLLIKGNLDIKDAEKITYQPLISA